MLFSLLSYVCWTSVARMAWAAFHLVSPEPRVDGHFANFGPCGNETDDLTTGPITTIQPGPYTVVIQETLDSPVEGQPWRIALSQEGTDVFDCVLLDHIPMHVGAGEYTLRMQVQIPDVDCNPCSLQVVQVGAGLLDSDVCCELTDDPNSDGGCNYVFHSCSNIIINGTGARDQVDCAALVPDSWPYKDWAPALYTAHQSTELWNTTDNALELELVLSGDAIDRPCNSSEDQRHGEIWWLDLVEWDCTQWQNNDCTGTFEPFVQIWDNWCDDDLCCGYHSFVCREDGIGEIHHFPEKGCQGNMTSMFDMTCHSQLGISCQCAYIERPTTTTLPWSPEDSSEDDDSGTVLWRATVAMMASALAGAALL